MSPAGVVAMVLAAVALLVEIVMVRMLHRIAPQLNRLELQAALVAGSWVAEGLEPGSVVPDFTLMADGGEIQFPKGIGGAPAVLLVVDLDDPSCLRLLREMQASGWWSPLATTIVIADRAVEGRSRLHPSIHLARERAGEISACLGTSITPHAFAVSPDGVVVEKDVPTSTADLDHLAEAAAMTTHEGQVVPARARLRPV